ncbi:FHA domain-containing protein [Nannocystis sp. SCPEA4]|uniref:FHA domain-containing protein n=1 Tax=Nannocystis sp. SCPEA4 TaxID=2996787 RepID=UPI00226F79A8|nr:FHA domain-containing protein [Nannocystis sp. SCPEA4]MCY1062850.1 FHA domain-containing protein [Nannocystis sp. SCPEA4]
MELGLACSVCGHLNQLRAVSCDRCAAVLAPQPIAPSAVLPGMGAHPAVSASSAPRGVTAISTAPAAAPVPGAQPQPSVSQSSPGKPPSTVISAAQQPSPAPAAQPRFNAVTGAPLDAMQGKPAAKTMFFGALQQQHVVPRLVVIKGEGGDGVTYHLSATNHVVGRSTGEIRFNEDFFLSPEHALFSVQGNRLFAKDLGSINGVFVRIKSPVPLDHGDCFLVGEQLLRLDSAPFNEPGPDANHTYSYTSPRPDARFRVVQLLAGGGEGRIVSAQGTTLTLGREANHMNFPQDRFISGRHARLDSASDSHHIILTDTGSRNGTFVRIKGAVELFHGDYIFIGQQLLRVEIS